MRKALLPDGSGVSVVAEETGISLQTLYNWLRKSGRELRQVYGFI